MQISTTTAAPSCQGRISFLHNYAVLLRRGGIEPRLICHRVKEANNLLRTPLQETDLEVMFQSVLKRRYEKPS